MKKFEITLFIMGCPSSSLNEIVEWEADTQEEAEQEAHNYYFPKGYGVLSSREIVDED